MAVKTFTNEVLTASDTNTYLANGGLVYIGQATATSGTTADVTGCFTATYDMYRVMLSDVRIAAQGTVTITMLAGTTAAASNWTFGGARFDYATGALSYDKATGSAQVTIMAANTNSGNATVDVGNPYLAQYTNVMATSTDSRGTTGYLPYLTSGVLANTTSYSGVRITSSQTISNIKVTVYGYRLG